MFLIVCHRGLLDEIRDVDSQRLGHQVIDVGNDTECDEIFDDVTDVIRLKDQQDVDEFGSDTADQLEDADHEGNHIAFFLELQREMDGKVHHFQRVTNFWYDGNVEDDGADDP